MKSHLEILRSSAWVGGSQVIILVFTLIRFKIYAVVLGTSGYGILELLLSAWELGYLIGGCGLPQSAVRYISLARASEGAEGVRSTLRFVKSAVPMTALATLLLFFIFREFLTEKTLGDSGSPYFLTCLGVGVMFQILCEGEKSIVLGFREVQKLAFGNAIGTISGTIITGLLVYILRERSIAWIFAINSMCSWLAMLVQRLRISHPGTDSETASDTSEILARGRRMMQLGLVLMPSAVYSFAVLYLTKVLIRDQAPTPIEGESQVGLFGQAYKVSAFYVNFVLAGMAADFLPRLTESIRDVRRTVSNVNDQIEVGILLVIPGIIGLVVFRDLVIILLGSPEFLGARDYILWMTAGCLGRVMSWPVAYLFVAGEKKKAFMIIETSAALVHALMVWYLINLYGAVGGAIAFALIYIIYGIIVGLVAAKVFSFRLSAGVLMTALAAGGLWAIACWMSIIMEHHSVSHWVVGILFIFVVCFICFWRLMSLLPEDSRMASRIRKFIPFLR